MRGNVLDLLTNTPGRIIEVVGVGRLVKSDHKRIKANIKIGKLEAKTTKNVPNCGRVNWGAIKKGHAQRGLDGKTEQWNG